MKVQLNTSNYKNIKTKPTSKDYPKTILQPYAEKISFGSSVQNTFKMSKKLELSLNIQKTLAKIVGQESNVKYYNLDLLEGLQEGIEAFKGLNLKQIAFVGEDFHSITAKRGCYSHCAYCYPGAETPIKQAGKYINSILFEDLESTANGYKKIRERSGINFIHSNSEKPYHSYVHDADNIEVAVSDLNGKTHEFPEISKLFYEATGQKGIFDTCGWSVSSKTHQQRAERIVKYYSNPKNMNELIQFNISINPFHSTLLKVNELKQKGNVELANKIYEKHTERLANALFTSIPVLEAEQFGVIKRAFSRDVPNMEGFYLTDELTLLNDVYKKVLAMCIKDYKTTQKYINNPHKLNRVILNFIDKLEKHGELTELSDIKIDTKLIAAPKLEKLILSRNPDMKVEEFDSLFPDVLENEEKYDNIVQFQKYRSAYMHYLKIIDANGKVYLTDAYRVIPTDIQLNFKNKDKQTDPFKTLVENFTLTTKMI